MLVGNEIDLICVNYKMRIVRRTEGYAYQVPDSVYHFVRGFMDWEEEWELDSLIHNL